MADTTDQDKAKTAEVKRIEKIQRLKKQLFKLENRAAVGSLLGPSSILSDSLREKERKIVLEALALGIDVHNKVLGYYGLGLQPNPKVPARFDGEDPF